MEYEDEVSQLLSILPEDYNIEKEDLYEFIVDLGRCLEFRDSKGSIYIEDEIIDKKYLDSVLEKVGNFGSDNRAGISGTLHRISRILDRNNNVVGLTCRIGKPHIGTVKLFQDLIDEGHNILLLGKPGIGKAQPLSSKVLTPTGWKLMGDIKVGDFVINGNGNPNKVIGVYPQGIKEIFEITTSDGSKTKACGDHLWETYQHKNTGARVRGIHSTLDISKTLIYDNQSAHQLPRNPIANFIEQGIPLDPYIIGCLLGDGSLTQGARLTNNDDEVISRFRLNLPEHSKLVLRAPMQYQIVGTEYIPGAKSKFNKIMLDLGMENKKSYEKNIPSIYLINSVDNRIKLLQGLIDTDGCIDSKGRISYRTSSLQLAKDIQFLISSLGGNTRFSSRMGTYINRKGVLQETRVHYFLHISLPDSVIPTSITRKKIRLQEKGNNKRRLHSLSKHIINITHSGEETCQCIMLEGLNNLYITDDFIITHNTSKLRDISRYLSDEKHRRVIVIDSSNEIAGDGVVPHSAVGRSRRMQVPFNKDQYQVLIECVENHTPEVVIIDEIGTRQEAESCRTIAQRGVQLIATAHGNTLEDLLNNPPLVSLIGGVMTVTLSDSQANIRGTTKSVQERQYPATFTAIVELESFDKCRVISNVEASIDAQLDGGTVTPEYRQLTTDGRVVVLTAGRIDKEESIYKFDEEEVKQKTTRKRK